MKILEIIKRIINKRKTKEEEMIYSLVTQWALATGKTGSRYRRSRRNKILTLKRNGINSEYARKVMNEIKQKTKQ